MVWQIAATIFVLAYATGWTVNETWPCRGTYGIPGMVLALCGALCLISAPVAAIAFIWTSV